MSEDRIWRYRTWGQKEATVVGSSIRFTPHHVVWEDEEGAIILAEKVENVNELSEVGHGGSATRGVRGRR